MSLLSVAEVAAALGLRLCQARRLIAAHPRRIRIGGWTLALPASALDSLRRRRRVGRPRKIIRRKSA